MVFLLQIPDFSLEVGDLVYLTNPNSATSIIDYSVV
jgi:hypothetical protein